MSYCIDYILWFAFVGDTDGFINILLVLVPWMMSWHMKKALHVRVEGPISLFYQSFIIGNYLMN